MKFNVGCYSKFLLLLINKQPPFTELLLLRAEPLKNISVDFCNFPLKWISSPYYRTEVQRSRETELTFIRWHRKQIERTVSFSVGILPCVSLYTSCYTSLFRKSVVISEDRECLFSILFTSCSCPVYRRYPINI